MLDKNPANRISLVEAMSHEWVTREGIWPPQWDDGDEVNAKTIVTRY